MRYLLALIAFSPLAAQEPTESDWKRLCQLESAVNHKYNEPATKNMGPFFRGDVFYWTARETGLTYALDVSSSGDSLSLDEVKFDWSFGFRAEVGANFFKDGWDLGLCWTRFYTEAKEQTPYTTGYFIPIWSNPNYDSDLFTVDFATAKWNMHYTQLDLPLGRACRVGKYFVIRPFLGPSALWINQTYRLQYQRPALGIIPFGEDNSKLKNNFEGYGLNAGCDLRFGFHQGWSIFGKANAGIYYGHFFLKDRESFTDVSGFYHTFKIKHHLQVGSPTLAAAMGIGYDHSFAQGKCYFSFRLLWEQLLFFSQNQLFRFVSPSASESASSFVANQGDLSMQGGTFSLAFGF